MKNARIIYPTYNRDDLEKAVRNSNRPLNQNAPVPTPAAGSSGGGYHIEEGPTFCEMVMYYLRKTQIDNKEIYRRIGIDRRLLHKVISGGEDYNPSKATAIAMSIAFRLTLDDMQEFIGTAGYCLTRSLKSDRVVMKHIIMGDYNMDAINNELYDLGYPPLVNKRDEYKDSKK